MSNIPNLQIPPLLKRQSRGEYDVSIIIGENGSGKSSLLFDLAKHFQEKQYDIVAIANTIYDKFILNKKKFKILRASEGRNIAKKVIISAVQLLVENDYRRLGNVARTLEFIGFEPRIGFRITSINPAARDIIKDLSLPKQVIDGILSYFDQYVHEFKRQKDIISINVSGRTTGDFHRISLFGIFTYEKILRKAGLFKNIELFLYRSQKAIPLHSASSGELTLVATLIFLTVAISENTVALIDEPENSLHPTWQKDYVKLLFDLFYLYQPKIIIATHSALILNGAEVNFPNLSVFKGVAGTFSIHKNQSTNVEEIYQDIFDVTTPKNRFVSELIVDKINALTNREITLPAFDLFIEDLMKGSYDDQQLKVLEGVKEMASKIANDIN